MGSDKDKEDAHKRFWIEKLSSHSTLSRRYTSPTTKTEEDKALIRLALHRSPFFTCMDEEQIERFIKVAELRTYAPGEMVILEGKIDSDEPPREVSDEETSEDTVTTESQDNEESKEYVMVNLEQHNPLEDAASTLKQDSSAETLVGPENVENIGPADVEEVDDMFSDENGTEPVQEAVRIVAEVAAAERIPLDMEQVSQDAKTKRASMSGQVSHVYAIQSGNADVWHENFNTASLGPGHIFGEGGFLFHRQHSASVVASPNSELSCWVVPIHLFMSYVLPSMHMMNKFVKYASRETESGEPYMTMVSSEKVERYFTLYFVPSIHSHGCFHAFARMTLYSALRMKKAITRVA